MSFTCHAHKKNCTLAKALLWGMCRSHFYQAKIQSQLEIKIMHLALAIFECCPIIGQIISLIELKYVLSHQQLQPLSCNLKFDREKRQESANDIMRIWPKDLSKLGLNESQKDKIDKHIQQAFKTLSKGGNIGFSKNKLEYNYRDQTKKVNLPFSLNITKVVDTATYQILLFPKTVFASGGERTIRWAYDLTKGEFLLKKRIVGSFEKEILVCLNSIRLKNGRGSPLIWRTAKDKTGKEKLQLIEPIQEGSLAILFNTAPLAHFSVKRELILDLLQELEALNQVSISCTVSLTKSLEGEHQTPRKFAYAAFHADIKPLNVLVSLKNEKWRAELCDFGQAAANPCITITSTGYTPPEYIRFYHLYKKQKSELFFTQTSDRLDLAEFTVNHGHGRDIWSMGLVILTLLVGREEEISYHLSMKESIKSYIPPLRSLKSVLSGWQDYNEQGTLKLTQEALDADLDQLENEVMLKHPEEKEELAKIFLMLKTKMLRIKPEERVTVDTCLALFQSFTKH